MKNLALALSILLAACGGGGSSPSAPSTTATTLPPRDGVIALNGAIGGSFTLSSSPARLSRTLFGCGDAVILIPYRETAGGGAVGGDYEVRLLEYNDDSARTAGSSPASRSQRARAARSGSRSASSASSTPRSFLRAPRWRSTSAAGQQAPCR